MRLMHIHSSVHARRANVRTYTLARPVYSAVSIYGIPPSCSGTPGWDAHLGSHLRLEVGALHVKRW